MTEADITNLLNKWLTGDEAARNELFDVVYENLRGMAKHYMVREKQGHTLRPTDLVHEAFIKVQAYNPGHWQNRAHFYAVFARAMRQILVDHARGKLTDKRGRGLIRIPLEEIGDVPDKHYVTLVKLDSLLDQLTQEDSIACSVFHLRHFTGLTAAEISEVLDINVTKVNRSLRYAKLWLQRALKAGESGSPAKESRLVLLIGFFVVMLLTASRAPAQEIMKSSERGLTHPTVNLLPAQAKRWALLIGVDQYEDSNITPLRGAANDANALKDTLVQYAGFPADQVIVLSTSEPAERQPTRKNILKRLSNLSGLVPKDGLLLISFAGHGIDRRGHGFLIPSDATLTEDLGLLEDTAVSVNHIKQRIKDTGVQQVMILLDACRSYPTGRSNASNPLTTGFTKEFSFDVANREVSAFALLYATAVGDRAYEYGEKRRGYFSWAITQALSGAAANERGEVTLLSLVKYLEDTVPKLVALEYGAKTTQRPFAQIEGYRADELVVALSHSTANNPGKFADTGDLQLVSGPEKSPLKESLPVKTRGAKSGNVAIVFVMTKGGDGGNDTANANEFIGPLTASIYKSGAGLSVKGVVQNSDNADKIVRDLSKKSSPYALIVKSTVSLSLLAPYNGLEIYEANGSLELIDTDSGKIILTDNISRRRGFGNSRDQARRNALKSAAEGVSESFLKTISANANE